MTRSAGRPWVSPIGCTTKSLIDSRAARTLHASTSSPFSNTGVDRTLLIQSRSRPVHSLRRSLARSSPSPTPPRCPPHFDRWSSSSRTAPRPRPICLRRPAQTSGHSLVSQQPHRRQVWSKISRERSTTEPAVASTSLTSSRRRSGDPIRRHGGFRNRATTWTVVCRCMSADSLAGRGLRSCW
jgi:hypothetical protein